MKTASSKTTTAMISPPTTAKALQARPWTARLSLTIFLAVVSSCAFSARVTEDAVAYNQSVEAANSRILFLNIIRAMKQRPMVFTEISQIRGNLRASFEPGASEIPIGGDATDLYKLNPRASYTSNPSFDVAVLSSEKFMRGILTPISMDIIHGYWIQGWPEELIFFLCIRRLDLMEDGVLTTYENEPNDPDKFDRFARKVTELREHQLKTESVSLPPVEFGPPANLAESSQLLALVEAAKANLSIIKTETGYQLTKSRSRTQFTFKLGIGQDSEKIQSFSALQTSSGDDSSKSPGKSTARPEASVVYTRSAEGIIYYLGEVMRRGMKDPSPLMITVNRKKVPLFVARKGASLASESQATVTYDGEDYFIPADSATAGQSTHCMTLAAQILALHKSSEELPKTPAATIIGGL